MIRSLDETTVRRLSRRNTVLFRIVKKYPADENNSYYVIIENNKQILFAITTPSETEFNKYDVLLAHKNTTITKIGTVLMNDEKSIKNLINKKPIDRKEIER